MEHFLIHALTTFRKVIPLLYSKPRLNISTVRPLRGCIQNLLRRVVIVILYLFIAEDARSDILQ